jgi:hypothetical protein
MLEETKPNESTSPLKTPEPAATRLVTPNESTAPATTHQPAPANPNHAEVSPAPQPGHVTNKSAAHVETATSKRPVHVDEEEHEETNPAPLKPAQTNQHASNASPNESIEVKAPKPHAPKPTEHRLSTEISSQTSSAQSPVSGPHAVKEAPPSVTPPLTERATMLVSPNAFLPPTSETAARGSQASATPATETSRLVDQTVEDPGLSVNVMPHSAHLSIKGDSGDLSLHVRVRDGSADVNVSGTMAPLFHTKAPEMRTALAGEGLQLGSFATDQRGGSQGQQGQQGQPDPPPRTNAPQPLPPPRPTNASTPEVKIAADQRIHVTA